MSTAPVLAGVDGCRHGWVAVVGTVAETPRITLYPRFADLLADIPDDAIVAVDMPIGLPDRIAGSGRGPEQAIRRHLGRRQSSVFTIPSRAAVYAEEKFEIWEEMLAAHRRASAVARATSDPPRGVAIQAFCLFPKIREIDALMTREMERRVFEVHPELAFWRLNGERAMTLPKKIKGSVNPEGMAERRTLLAANGFSTQILEADPPRGAAADDLLDACACHMIARRLAEGTAKPFPDPPLKTETGARMAIWA